MTYRPSYKVATMVFVLLTVCFALAYYTKKTPPTEHFVYLPTNAPVIIVTNVVAYTNVTTLYTNMITVQTNVITYTNLLMMLTNTTVVQTTIHTNPTVTYTNTVTVYAPAPAPIVVVTNAPQKPLDTYFSDDVGLRPILATNTIPSTGMSELTFSLTWNPADSNSLRVALIPTTHLEDNTAETISLGATENLARINRRCTQNPDGSTNTAYYVVHTCVSRTKPPRVTRVEQGAVKLPDILPPSIVTNVPVTPERTREIPHTATSETEKPLVAVPLTELSHSSAKITDTTVAVQETPPPIIETVTPKQEKLVINVPPAIQTEPTPVPEIPLSSHRTSFATVRMKDGTWVNPGQLPPPLVVDKVTYSVTLTDYTMQLGTWWGIHQDTWGTTIYYPKNEVAPCIGIIGPYRLRVIVSHKNGTNRTSQSFYLALMKKTSLRKLKLVPADEDALKFGVAYLREKTKNGWTYPPMTLALHPELHPSLHGVAKIPDAPQKKVKRVAALSPRAASQQHTLMRR
ncbi:MAG: hypothetical protein Q7R93_01655 [bacterium]|nr:hypothetical protein [bacterium]